MTETHRAGPVVVTGGAGAIGSCLARTLVDRGEEVRVVDNLSSGRREHLAEPMGSGRLALTVADLRDPTGYRDVFRGAARVWHLAANADIRLGWGEPSRDLENGTLATFHVLETARQLDVPEVHFASSSVVYGYPTVFPTPESYGPLEPQSLYAAAKLAGEGLCSAYAHSYGVRTAIFRFANIIGPGMTRGVLYDFFEKLRRDPSRLEVLGDGRQSKSYLRTEDCVDGMLLATEKDPSRVSIYNLGTRDRISVREIAEKVVTAHGGGARIDYTGGERGWVGDVPQQLLAIDKIERLGWRPRFSSGGAVDRTIRELQDAARNAGGAAGPSGATADPQTLR